MNVLAIAQYFPPDLGGSATRVSNVVKGLSLNGCQVTIITAFPHYPHGTIPKEYKWVPIKVELVGKIKVIRTFILPLKSQGILKRLILMGSFAISSLFALPWIGKIDVVWAPSWVPGILYSKLKRTPVVLDVCDLTVEDLPGLKLVRKDSFVLNLAATIYRFFYVKADAVTPISPGYVNTISGKYCVKRDKIHVVNVGVDLTTFRNNLVKNPKNKSFKVIYAGVLGVGYDFEQIFKAAQIIKKQEEDIEFIIHGGGERLISIRKRIRELNLTNVQLSDVLFSSRKEVANFLNEADVLILPLKDYGSPYPGIPSKLYEYQALGKPIICCARGEPAKYIENSNSGVVVTPDNSSELAQAILSLSHDQSKAKQLGASGRLFVEENSSLEKIGLRMKSVFEKASRNCQRR